METMRFGTLVRVALLAVTLVGALVGGGAAPARAAFTCTQLLQDTTLKDNVTVPAGETCDLIDVVVRGGVTVEPGGTFLAFESEIRGSVVATGHLVLDLRDVEVRGNVTATGGVDASSFLLRVRTRGNVVLIGNVQSTIGVLSSNVRGSVTINGNTTTGSSLLEVENNTIKANLNCEGNNPDTLVNGNIVGGGSSGQCAVQ